MGAAVCGANRQDATFAGPALASVVVKPPLADRVGEHQHEDPHPHYEEEQSPRRRNGKRSTGQLAKLRAALWNDGPDVRAMPYLRGDGNFAKVPAQCDAKHQGFRLWAPAAGQSRRGLGRIRAGVEWAHALVNQFGRVSRRFDRRERRYLGWVQLASCLIFMRQGFFP